MVQLAIPDVVSLPLNVTVTGWLYQPPASGARSGDAVVTTGASVSILNCRWNWTVDEPSVAVNRLVGARSEGLDEGAVGVGGTLHRQLRGDGAAVPPVIAHRAGGHGVRHDWAGRACSAGDDERETDREQGCGRAHQRLLQARTSPAPSRP